MPAAWIRASHGHQLLLLLLRGAQGDHALHDAVQLQGPVARSHGPCRRQDTVWMAPQLPGQPVALKPAPAGTGWQLSCPQSAQRLPFPPPPPPLARHLQDVGNNSKKSCQAKTRTPTLWTAATGVLHPGSIPEPHPSPMTCHLTQVAVIHATLSAPCGH